MKKFKLLYILPLAALVACEPEFDDVDFNAGSADFSRMVAVGNSLTAGYQSGALSAEGQKYSLPNIIAEQMKQVGGGNFSQPIIPGEAGIKGVGLNAALPPGVVAPEFALSNSTDCRGTTSLAPGLSSQPYPAPEFFNNIAANGPFNNVAVPGAKATHMNFVGYASPQGNPYFGRFAASQAETVVQAAMKTNHTFFQLWIGNNDVLGYATSGGDEGSDAITSSQVFAAVYNQTLDSLTKNGQKGVVANIPDVTTIPYFNTVPPGTDAITAAQAQQLMAPTAYAGYNALLDAAVQIAAQKPWITFTQEEADKRKINFTAGQFNYFIVSDLSLSDLTDTAYTSVDPRFAGAMKIRQLKAGELMTLVTPGDSLLCGGWGTAKPIPGNFYLSSSEISAIASATAAYNAHIKSEADKRGLAFVDANSFMTKLKTTGLTYSGIDFNAALVTGGAFSLDGVHPSTRGYAILANIFIDAINAKYSANVPKVDVGSYPALETK